LSHLARHHPCRPPLTVDRNVAGRFIIAPGVPRHGACHEDGGASWYNAAMTLGPLLDASPQIQVHAFAAIPAFGLGFVQLSAPKGTLPHRTVGWAWVALMFAVCISSFFIHQIRMWGPWSPIHLLSIFVLIMLPIAVMAARRHMVANHRRHMLGLFLGALVIAGVFTFWPGRIMHAVVFGT
jgi:uncharacterized membrane protein